ncbi:MAG TPA: hypothetical protein VNA14_13015 [Mycobacteriales bacterium]|nr:hypothetical protein [Mycobacteriales bacterium]
MALLLTAVTAAVGLGGLAGLGRLFGASPLDYARGPLGGYFPLTDSFVQDELGSSFGRNVQATVPVPLGPDRPGVVSPDPAAGPADSVPPPDETRADLGNDDFASAYAVRGLPFAAKSAEPSRRQPGEPTSCADSGGTRWYRFTSQADVGLTATTVGSDPSTALAAFTGSSLSGLAQVACDTDARGNAQVAFPGKAGTTYWFQVTKTLADGAAAFNLNVQGRTSLASAYDDGRAADQDALRPRVSGNGRYVAFTSGADLGTESAGLCVSPDPQSALSPGGCVNVYVRDLLSRRTILVSAPDSTAGGNHDDSIYPAITPDGRFVSFSSVASDLVPGDTNGTADVFVRDLVAKRTIRVSVTSSGGQTTDTGDDLEYPGPSAISADGRYVAFTSAAPELVGPAQSCAGGSYCKRVVIRDILMGRTHVVVNETGELEAYTSVIGLSADGRIVAWQGGGSVRDSGWVFVSEWRGRQVERASVSSDGEHQVIGYCHTYECLSADGRYVAFASADPDVVPEDGNDAVDFFVRDLVGRRTVRVSVSSTGAESHPLTPTALTLCTGASPACPGIETVAISPDGRYVTFSSNADDLVLGDDNENFDVFVHDLRRGTTTRVSVLDDGTQSSGVSYWGSVSTNARVVAFTGRAFRAEDDRATRTVYVRQMPTVR